MKDKDVPLIKLASQMSRDLNVKIDEGIAAEIVSLFNCGVLRLFCTHPKSEVYQSSYKTNLTVSQCLRVDFYGKGKIIELEKKIEKMQVFSNAQIAENNRLEEYIETWIKGQ